MSVHAGDWFDDRFRLDEPLGSGAFGEVWRASTRGGESVVIKRLRSAAQENRELAARFEQELRAARRLGPPHFLELVDGRASDGYFVVWRYVEGVPLDVWLEDTQPSRAERLHVLDQMLAAVSELHAAGILHRDLKPEHVLVTCEQRVLLVDLGICRLGGGVGLTRSRHILGSAAFMAPEQADAPARVDERADLYAAGVIAFWLLSGSLPVWAPKAQAMVVLKRLRDAPTLASVTGEEEPAALETWLARLLARDPSARHPSADEARWALALATQ